MGKRIQVCLARVEALESLLLDRGLRLCVECKRGGAPPTVYMHSEDAGQGVWDYYADAPGWYCEACCEKLDQTHEAQLEAIGLIDFW